MKLGKIYFKILALTFLVFSLGISTSCSPKTGCPINDEATAKVNRKGELSKKRGKSELFSPKGAINVKKAHKKRKKQRQKLYGKRKS